jgi:hypothetical protein
MRGRGDVETPGGVDKVRGGQSWDNNGEDRAVGMEFDGGLVRGWIRGNRCGEESEALVPFIGRRRRGPIGRVRETAGDSGELQWLRPFRN